MKNCEKMANCNDAYCEYYDDNMELNCSYSEDNTKCVRKEKDNKDTLNSLQQLKVEIATMLTKWKHCCEMGVDWYEVESVDVERLRQLTQTHTKTGQG